MSRRRRHHDRQAKLEALRQQDKLDALARGVAVDFGSLVPNNSYSAPEFMKRGYYVDEPFVCRSCGEPQVWTAEQQKWWYEVAKGDVFSTATQCRACRQRERSRRQEARLRGGDPNPYKNPGLLLAMIRREIEPRLLAAGYRLAGRVPRGGPRYRFIDYSRSEDVFTLSWDHHHARLAAELLPARGSDLRLVAAAEFSGVRSTSEIEARLVPFMVSLGAFLDFTGGPGQEPESRREITDPDKGPGV
jgi:hypothetical protein